MEEIAVEYSNSGKRDTFRVQKSVGSIKRLYEKLFEYVGKPSGKYVVLYLDGIFVDKSFDQLYDFNTFFSRLTYSRPQLYLRDGPVPDKFDFSGSAYDDVRSSAHDIVRSSAHDIVRSGTMTDNERITELEKRVLALESRGMGGSGAGSFSGGTRKKSKSKSKKKSGSKHK